MNKLSAQWNKKIIPSLIVCMVCGIFAGCASTPKAPTGALQAAELAIAKAEQDRVADYASPELSEAREKLTAARVAVAEKEMVRAARLAEQARADAELASAKTQSAKAQEVNAELDKNADILQRELQRNSGGAL
ncbi:DUF4398 domain-containing protein [Cellvibrio sp. UBA7661]|uniref:DUF4398 domain-containing protein n=1 Tax=Cellvibrio sp. UBA7661 TaxID=1946311 RepID=UPI002F3597D9